MSSPPPPDPRFALNCRACGKVAACPHADVSRYVQVGWPYCCGRLMTLTFRVGPADEPPCGDDGK